MSKTFSQAQISDQDIELIGKKLKNGSLAVLPTDTIYGLHSSVGNPKNIERIYQLKKRDLQKPFIILISDISQLEFFGIILNATQKNILQKIWPNKISIIFDCPNPDLKFLHRGTNSLAIRFPNNSFLQTIISYSGPIISTSVNLGGEKPITSIKQAKEILGENIDFYIDNGELNSSPSTVIRFNGSKIEILRLGDIDVTKLLD